MIVKCLEKDVGTIISYIQHDYPKCLYLYMDLKKYGISSGLLDAYLQLSENEIKAVYLSYYSCLHVYSRHNDFNALETLEILDQHRFSMIYCTEETAKIIWDAIPDKSCAKKTTGWVARIRTVDKPDHGSARLANTADFEQIAKMIYTDEDIGKSYIYSELAKQLRERSSQGYTRNLVIKDNNTIIAHACTNAEIDGIAVVAELVVNPGYRKKGYGAEIWRSLCSQLLREKKEVYSFYYSSESRALHRKIGFEEECEWGKIVFQYD